MSESTHKFEREDFEKTKMSAGEVDLSASRKKARAQVMLKQSDYQLIRN
jgi:hypothetical protein